MGLFKTDLYRSFAIGFVLGAILVAGFAGNGRAGGAGGMVPSAVAAPAR